MLRIKLVRSPIGNTAHNRATVKALGLRKMHQVVEHDDSSSIRGMIHRVQHLVHVETVEGTRSTKTAAKPAVRVSAKPAAKVEAPTAEKKAPAAKAAKAAPVEKAKKPAPKPRKKAEPEEVKE